MVPGRRLADLSTFDNSFTKTAIFGPQKLTPKWTQNVTQTALQKGTQNDIKNDSKLSPKWTQICIKIGSKMESKMIKIASQNSFNKVSKPLATFEKYSNHVTTWAPKFTSLNKKCSKKSKSDSNVFNLLAAIAKHSH